MVSSSTVDAFKGAWDYVEGDNNDEYLRELGVGLMARTMAKGLKPRIIIDEKNGKWTLSTETIFKTMTIEFTPNEEFTETTGDGRELKGIIRFEDGKWLQNMRDKNGKPSSITRWIDENGQMKIISECGKAKVNKIYKRTDTK